MSTMQQLTYLKPKHFEWWEVPTPTISTGIDAIVRPTAVARCDLDFYIAIGGYPAPGPFAIGHEMTAVVHEVGNDVSRFSADDAVVVPFQISCGECKNCRRGWTNACTSEPPCAAYGLGTHPDGDYGGALSDFVRVPYADAMLVKLPESLSPEAGAGLSDNVADGYRTVADGLAQFPGEPVLIVGGLAQSVGLYAVHAARALGSTKIVYTDHDETRLLLAASAGAEVARVEDYESAERADGNFLITVDASAQPAGLAYAIRSTAPCGFCTGVSGGLTPTTELPLSSAYLRGITYNVSRVHARTVLPETLRHACNGTIDPLSIVTRTVSFEDSIEAMFDPSPKVIFSR